MGEPRRHCRAGRPCVVDVAGAVLEPEDLPDLRQVREHSLQAIEYRSFLLSRRIAQPGGVLQADTTGNCNRI